MARFVAVSADKGKVVYINADTVTMIELRGTVLILRVVGAPEVIRLDYANEGDAVEVLGEFVGKQGGER